MLPQFIALIDPDTENTELLSSVLREYYHTNPQADLTRWIGCSNLDGRELFAYMRPFLDEDVPLDVFPGKASQILVPFMHTLRGGPDFYLPRPIINNNPTLDRQIRALDLLIGALPERFSKRFIDFPYVILSAGDTSVSRRLNLYGTPSDQRVLDELEETVQTQYGGNLYEGLMFLECGSHGQDNIRYKQGIAARIHDLYRNAHLIASGGIRSVKDVEALHAQGLYGSKLVSSALHEHPHDLPAYLQVFS